MEYERIAPLMGNLWSPLAAVTSQWQDKANAQIAVAIAAASIVPSMPRVVVQIYKTNYSHDLIHHSGAFALNFLRKGQLHLIKDFGLVSGRDRNKLASVAYETGESGSPVLKDCWGYLDCRVVNAMDGGDMTCFLAEVLEGDTIAQGQPLCWRDARREIPAEWNEAWDRKIKGEIELSIKRLLKIDYTAWKPSRGSLYTSSDEILVPEQGMKNIEDIVGRIHDAPPKAVIAVAGAGSRAVAWLFDGAGASRTVLEVVVPYWRLSMIEFLGEEPDQIVSQETARGMARAAYRRAVVLNDNSSPVVGLACTATIATDRPKRGEHLCHVATWDDAGTAFYSLLLAKGSRDRAGEEDLVSRLVVQALAQACGLEAELPLELSDSDHLKVQHLTHPHPLARLLRGEASTVTAYPDGRLAVDQRVRAALLPGSFQPLHHGHEELARAAQDILGSEVVYELSVVNVDKPPLEEVEIRQRLAQFATGGTVVLTWAETFRKKTDLFPGCTFVIGWDTAVRLVAPRYYGGQESAMLASLAEMWAAGCRFLVAGRQDGGAFRTLADVPVPQGFQPLFQEIPESLFRADVSSTALRANG